MKKIMLFMLLAMLAVFAVACGSDTEDTTDTTDNDEAQEASNDQEEVDEGPSEIEVEHELGMTTVPTNPETVVVFDFGTVDTLDYLGVDIAAVPQANIPSYLNQFEADTYENAGTLFEPDFETLANLDPDLIIISGRTSEAYDDLADLAPTIYMGVDESDYMTSFASNVSLLGEIFNKQDEAQEAVEQVNDDLADLVAVVPEDETGLIVLTNDGALNAYGPGSRFGIIHDDFGIEPVALDIEAATHGQNISFEYVAEMDPDYLFVMDRNAVTGGDYTASTTLDNELINQTTAAQEDQIVYLTPDYWYLSSGGIESVTQMIAEIKQGIE
ncbi:siderophore ABC transporter substrate-binding protein [Amphibacillus cookii]|uniref:siderophore ABC transporter substrate-binding protein n=1 Tax=Amphibacillus cookii TaxID=767787 RepID=UPI00195E2E7C|nr:siderophore ABC transporter substrate-binding protein [Amphibacillus cookii]MBM7541482.1 iron complex transport system substrate-binding protein [Amphibacillus cookii]